MAEPVIVDSPPTNPSEFCSDPKNISATKSSGIELDMALIVAPRTPGAQPLPKNSEPLEIHSLDFHISQLDRHIAKKRAIITLQNYSSSFDIKGESCLNCSMLEVLSIILGLACLIQIGIWRAKRRTRK